MGSDKQKITKEDLQKRIAMQDAARELDRMKKTMIRDAEGKPTTAGAGLKMPLENLTTIGLSSDQIIHEIQDDLKTMLDKIGELAFAPDQRKRYFHNNKLITLVKILKMAGMEMEARSVMDIFKDRVKQINGGKLPTIKEKQGFFSKTTERALKVEEIATKFEVEVDIPASNSAEVAPLTVVGTQKSLMNHMNSILLQNEEVVDPFKKQPRKTLGKFLQCAGLMNPATENPEEKFFVAALLTPDSIQPKSLTDKDKFDKFSKILKKAIKWVEQILEQRNKEAEAAAAPPAPPDASK